MNSDINKKDDAENTLALNEHNTLCEIRALKEQKHVNGIRFYGSGIEKRVRANRVGEE